MTVWIFGDSYAQYYDLEDQWMKRIATELNTDLISFGVVGSSIEYTFEKFNSIRTQITTNDVVVIALTTPSRRWHFREHPSFSVYLNYHKNSVRPYLTYGPTGYNDVDKSLKYYELYLKNDIVYDTQLINFLYNLNYITEKLNLKTFILINFYDIDVFLREMKDNFSSLIFSNEILFQISVNEYNKKYLPKHDYSKRDIKVNHLIKSNHIILADMILDNIKNKKELDLRTGFVEDIIDESKFLDKDFIKNEFFDGAVYRD